MWAVLSDIAAYLAMLGVMIFPLLTIHCFYDDNVTVTNRKLLVFALLPLFSYIIDLFPKTELPVTYGYVIAAPIIAVLGGKMPFFRRFINWSRYIIIVILFLLTLFPLTIAFSSIFQNNGTDMETDVFTATAAIYSLLPSLVMYLVYIRKGKSLLFRKQDKFIVWLYFFFIFFMIGAVYEPEDMGEGLLLSQPESTGEHLIHFFTVFIITLMPLFIIRNCQSSHYARLSEHQQYFLEAELNASKQYKAAQEEPRAFRHDVQNNLTAVSMLMEQGKYDEAKQYIDDMRTEVSSFSPKVITGDEMLDSIVSAKLVKMHEDRIKFTINGVIDGGLGWKPMDICSVFANALDNAIEAASKAEGERFVTMSLKKTANQRLIRLENNCAEDIDCTALTDESLHFTSKADKGLHGFGIRNMKKVIEKNGGMMKISCENKRFTLDMILSRDTAISR